MYRNIAFLFLLLVPSGCWYDQDGRCPSYSMSAFEAVEQDIRTQYGPVTDDVLNDLELTCTHFVKTLPGELFQIGGVAYPPNEIELRIYPTLRMTAYVHEVIHLIKWQQHETVDPDHANGEGPWTEADDEFIFSVWGI